MTTNNTIFKDINDFKRCLKTLTEDDTGLINCRNYKVPNNIKNLSHVELENINKEPYYLIEISNHKNDNNLENNNNLHILFVREDSIFNHTATNKKKLLHTKYLSNIKNNANEISLVVIVTDDKKKSEQYYKSITNNLNKYTFNNLTIFHINYLRVNCMNHCYQPKFKLITDINEIQQIKKKYNINNLSQLQKKSINDPVSKIFGAKIGNIFEITEITSTNGKNINYKIID